MRSDTFVAMDGTVYSGVENRVDTTEPEKAHFEVPNPSRARCFFLTLQYNCCWTWKHCMLQLCGCPCCWKWFCLCSCKGRNVSVPTLSPQMADVAAARDLLLCARSRDRPTLRMCANNKVADPFVIDDVVWGFSLETLRTHIQSTSLMGRLRYSIDLVFINASSGTAEGNTNACGDRLGTDHCVDLRRLSSWQSVLTHFVFLINVDLSGSLQVTENRIAYQLPLFNKGGKRYTFEIFIHEETGISCCDCGNGDSVVGSSSSVTWDLVCSITQQAKSCVGQPLSSVLYAASWTDRTIVDACVVLEDERNPLVAFIALAHVFLAAGVPRGSEDGPL